MAEPHGQLMRYKKRRRRPSLFLRLRAQAGAFRAPARVAFFFCKKKVTKENYSNLRFKDPLARGGFRRPGGEQVLRLRAQAGVFRVPARVTFFCCQKKVTKENHLDLRSKGPLARCGSCRFGGMHSRAGCGGHHCRSKGLCLRSPARRLPRPLASATVGVFASTGWRLSNRAFADARRQR